MVEKKNIYRIIVVKYKGKRTLRRSKRSLVNNVKTYLKIVSKEFGNIHTSLRIRTKVGVL
jgi:hypothetical protein